MECFMEEFTHIDKQGHVRMVDVTEKKPSERVVLVSNLEL